LSEDLVVGPLKVGGGVAYLFHAPEGGGLLARRSVDDGKTWGPERRLSGGHEATYGVFYHPELDCTRNRMILTQASPIPPRALAINYLDPAMDETRPGGWLALLHVGEVDEVDRLVMMTDGLGGLLVRAAVYHHAEDEDVEELILWRTQDAGDTWEQVSDRRMAVVN
jgi:hypothetical protein